MYSHGSCALCVHNRFSATVKDNYSHSLWYFIKLRHNRFFLFWGCHPLQLLVFTRRPCFVPDTFVPQQPLCKHPPNWLVCSMCALCLWNRSQSLSVCFFLNYFLLTRLCCRSHCRVFIPEQHLPRAILASPTKKANKKDIYTHRDYFSVRATVQPQGGSIHSPTRARTRHQTCEDLQPAYMWNWVATVQNKHQEKYE